MSQEGVIANAYEVQMGQQDAKQTTHMVMRSTDQSASIETTAADNQRQQQPHHNHHHHQQQQQPQLQQLHQHQSEVVDEYLPRNHGVASNGAGIADRDRGSVDEDNAHNNTTSNNESSSLNQEDKSEEDTSLSMHNVSGGVKTPNSYKYPLLKRYFEFGPWIGRNRKALCLGCNLQTSSSQPDRLLKHLNRCNALSEADKAVVCDLMNERTANKRKKPVSVGKKQNSEQSDYGHDEDDEANSSFADDVSPIPIPVGGLKKSKREPMDRKSQIDEALTRFIMMCRVPLKAIHSREFVEFVRSLDPDYHIPSRETITNVLIPGLLNII